MARISGIDFTSATEHEFADMFDQAFLVADQPTLPLGAQERAVLGVAQQMGERLKNVHLQNEFEQLEIPYQAVRALERALILATKRKFVPATLSTLRAHHTEALDHLGSWIKSPELLAAADIPTRLQLAVRNSVYAVLATNNGATAVETLIYTLAGVGKVQQGVYGSSISANSIRNANLYRAASIAWNVIGEWNRNHPDKRNVNLEDYVFRTLSNPDRNYNAPTSGELERSLELATTGPEGIPRHRSIQSIADEKRDQVLGVVHKDKPARPLPPASGTAAPKPP